MIDYARFYGLIQDHLEDQPLQGLAAPHDFLSQLDDTADLFQISSDCVKVPEERLPVDAGTASLLSEIAALAKHAPPPFDVDSEFEVRRVRRMKRELPLLRTDHEVDLLRFASRIVPNLEREFLPLETIDEEADEGFEWPSTCHDLPDEYLGKFKAEKLVFPKEALIYLQEVLSFHLDGGSHAVFDDVELPYTRVCMTDAWSMMLMLPQKIKVQPVSPPLLHMSPVTLPFVPSSDTGRLELLSDHTSPTREEVREVERGIFDNHAIIPPKKDAEASSQDSCQMLLDSDDLGDLYSPLKSIADPPSSPPTRNSLQDRKVEVPLSPPMSEQLPPWKRKSVSWRESLTEVIYDVPLPIPKPEIISSDDIDTFFEETIRPIGIKAERSIEQEQLQEADTTLRVTVPIMDLSLPVAPWNASIQDSKANEKDRYKQTLSEMQTLQFSEHVWPISEKLDRELRWTAIPATLGKVKTEESIPDNGFIEIYLKPPERVDVETLTWKPDGLRIFDELTDPDEELEERAFPEEKDFESLIKKRKLELEDIEDNPQQCNRNPKLTRTEFIREIEEEQRTDIGHQLASFSALDALDSYIGKRKGHIEKPKLTADKYFSPAKATANTDPPQQVAKTIARAAAAEHRPMPSPVILVPTTAVPFVISASFLSNRKVSRHIQRLFPSAEFIERDFNLHLDLQQRPASKSNAGSMTQSTIADEADIILSPSTGLILTTLQKIKQRSLPGQVARSPVRERIRGATPRYERLLVLVSEDRQAGIPLNAVDDGKTQLDGRDCEALVELTQCCSALESEVLVTFIAGGEDDLAKWIVALMVKHGVTDPNIKLIQDETLWEVFLRRASMNAFAAQAILGSLKASDQDEGGVAAVFGLTAFLKMSIEERFARFETLLGGRRLLRRVSRVLDARW